MPQTAFPIIELVIDTIGSIAGAASERNHGCAVVLTIFFVIIVAVIVIAAVF